MERRSSAFYQRRHRDRLREQGLVKKELWVLPEYADELSAIERRMRRPQGLVPRERAGGDDTMRSNDTVWTAPALSLIHIFFAERRSSARHRHDT